jgi:hypothetical protein
MILDGVQPSHLRASRTSLLGCPVSEVARVGDGR